MNINLVYGSFSDNECTVDIQTGNDVFSSRIIVAKNYFELEETQSNFFHRLSLNPVEGTN